MGSVLLKKVVNISQSQKKNKKQYRLLSLLNLGKDIVHGSPLISSRSGTKVNCLFQEPQIVPDFLGTNYCIT